MAKRAPSKSKHRKMKMWELYKVEGGKVTRKAPFCPKCRSFLAVHEDRVACGKCGYAEMKKAA